MDMNEWMKVEAIGFFFCANVLFFLFCFFFWVIKDGGSWMKDHDMAWRSVDVNFVSLHDSFSAGIVQYTNQCLRRIQVLRMWN